ncbi:polysaccharide deacetylase [Bacillus sp. RG28]|uniref:Polysaccharide deacetylase n=1 Tax=Gottfriedia endophytica TaxID=2820819 RepID=A0A940NPW2_9BACI|nr:polysaccharide deacetylase family protein [Gottfriedia endophytica]MBP0724721.1 polysaccharide deacetylase [Gottfriedia endophytica]
MAFRKKGTTKNPSSFRKKFFVIFISSLLVLFIMPLLKLNGSSDNAKAIQNLKVSPVSKIKLTTTKKPLITTYNGKTQKVMYLTFDDGVSKYEKDIVNILEKNNVKATFFLIGTTLKEYPHNPQSLLQKGEYVGMHSMSHNYKKLYIEGHFTEEMLTEQKLLKGLTGKEIHLVRPPYGSKPGLTLDERNQLANSGLKMWDWTIDSYDWNLPHNPKQIINNVLRHANRNVEVVLLHEKKQTVEALPSIIKGLKAKGYTFKAYDEDQHFPLNFWHDGRL